MPQDSVQGNQYGLQGDQAPPPVAPPPTQPATPSDKRSPSQKIQDGLDASVDYYRQRLTDLDSEAGRQSFYKQEALRQVASGGGTQDANGTFALADPKALITAYNDEIGRLNTGLKYNSTIANQYRSTQDPVVRARLGAAAATAIADAQTKEYTQQQVDANGGLTISQLLEYQYKLAVENRENYKTQLEAGNYISSNDMERYRVDSNNLANQMTDARNLMTLAQQQEQAAAAEIGSNWRTTYNEAGKEWEKQYSEDVTQRGQDISAAHAMASAYGDMAGRVLPYVAPTGQLAAFYQKVGMDPNLAYQSAGAPSYNDLLNAPQQGWNQTLGHPGLPSQIQPPLSPDASGMPNPWETLGRTMNDPNSGASLANQALSQRMMGMGLPPAPMPFQMPAAGPPPYMPQFNSGALPRYDQSKSNINITPEQAAALLAATTGSPGDDQGSGY